jgi:DnaJ-class molecular chaperone
MKKSIRKVDCPACNGYGETVKGCYARNPIDPPMERCHYCSGKGEVSLEEAEDFDPEDESQAPQTYEDWKADQDYDR